MLAGFKNRSFWSPQRNRALWIGFRTLSETIGQRPSAFKQMIDEELSLKGLETTLKSPSAKTLGRYAESQDGYKLHLKSPVHKSTLLITCDALIANHFGDTNPLAPEIKRLRDLGKAFSRLLAERQPKKPTHEETPIDAAIKLISRYLHTDQDQLNAAWPLFCKEDGNNKIPNEAHFLCYRYDISPGEVAKSFLVVHKPTDLAPFCRFSNFLLHEQTNDRHARGIVVPMRQGVYFVGEIDDGAALKMMVFRRPNRAVDRYLGLVLTLGSFQEPITARIVMKRTNLTHHRSAGVGVFPEKLMQGEISDIARELRNRIPFKLSDDLTLDDWPCDQGKMVTLIADLLSPNGVPRLKTKDGVPFNPAADRHYTYNAALRLAGPAED